MVDALTKSCKRNKSELKKSTGLQAEEAKHRGICDKELFECKLLVV
ncbi:hypothetical protein AusDCA_0659 [Desulfitobacterium sp. AusDCA]